MKQKCKWHCWYWEWKRTFASCLSPALTSQMYKKNKNWISGCFGLGLEKKKKRGFNDLHEFKLGKINVEATDCAMIVYIFYELYS